MTVRRKEPARRRATESSIPPERVSHTSIVVPDEGVKSSRGVALAEVPSAWIDRLLVALGELPVASGDEAVVRSLVDAVGVILPTHAIGVCYVAGPGSAQRVFACVPVVESARVRGADPTRIFPGFSHERVFEVAGVSSGTTLHIAGDDPSLDDARSAPAHIARRAAEGLSRALEHARAYAAAEEARGALRDMADGVIQTEKLASFGELAAGLVHELNNPLTSIVAYSDILLKQAIARGDDDADTERIRRVGESAQRMLRFTRDVVAYVRPADDDAVAPVDIHHVIDRAFAFCEHVVDEARAKVERRYDARVASVPGVAERLTQVFVNVVTNACHALAEGSGVISVTTELVDDGGRVRITFSDTGRGSPPSTCPTSSRRSSRRRRAAAAPVSASPSSGASSKGTAGRSSR